MYTFFSDFRMSALHINKSVQFFLTVKALILLVLWSQWAAKINDILSYIKIFMPSVRIELTTFRFLS